MDPAIAKQRDDLAKEVTNRTNLSADELDPALSFGALLNPTLHDEVRNGLFTMTQHTVATSRLKEECWQIADRLFPQDRLAPAAAADDDDDDDRQVRGDMMYGVARPPSLGASSASAGVPTADTAEVRTARELTRLGSLKNLGYQPEIKGSSWGVGQLALGGTIKGRRFDFERGDGKNDNLANYYTGSKVFDIVSFYRENQTDFPILWVLVQKVACMVSTSAGSERAFTKAGFTVQPERANLGTKTYERLVVVNINMSNVYVLPEDIEQEFVKRKEAGDWNLKEDLDDELFCNAEGAGSAGDDDDDDDDNDD